MKQYERENKRNNYYNFSLHLCNSRVYKINNLVDMSVKEKAQELFDKFSAVPLLDSYEAKQCALIAVDEIINDWINNLKKLKEEEITIKHSLDEMMALSHSIKYWNEVKQEIENYENTN